MPDKHGKQLRFLVVGGWNTVFGYGLFAGLYFATSRLGLHYMVAAVISNLIAVANAYLCYKLFVFKTKGNYLREYLRFNLSYAGLFAFNLAALPLLVNLARLSPLIAQAALLVVTVAVSYVMHNYFSFGSPAG
ncbi:MAG: GtrA family protein [Elusimicrobia bacterium]|nr:GtrA family protein [Elusimicrobiota bacterium]